MSKKLISTFVLLTAPFLVNAASSTYENHSSAAATPYKTEAAVNGAASSSPYQTDETINFAASASPYKSEESVNHAAASSPNKPEESINSAASSPMKINNSNNYAAESP